MNPYNVILLRGLLRMETGPKGRNTVLSLTPLDSPGLCDVVCKDEVIVHLCVLPASRSLPSLGSPNLVWIGRSCEMMAKSNLRTLSQC